MFRFWNFYVSFSISLLFSTAQKSSDAAHSMCRIHTDQRIMSHGKTDPFLWRKKNQQCEWAMVVKYIELELT